MERNRKPQYRTLVKALSRMSNAVHDELEGEGDTVDRRRELGRAMDHADQLIVRAEDAMAQQAAKKENTNVNSSS